MNDGKLYLYIIYTIYGFIVTYPLIFIAVYTYQLGGIIATAFIYAISAISIGIAPIFISPFSDRSGYRIRYALISIFTGSIIMILSSILDKIALILIILSSAIIQIGQPLFISYETERSKLTGSSVGKVYLYINFGYLIGSLVFGFVLTYIDFKMMGIIFGLIGIILSLTFFYFKEDKLFSFNPNKTSIIRTLLTTNKFNLLSSFLVIILALFYSIVPAYYVFFLNGKILDWGIVNAISTLTGVISSPYIGKITDRIGTKKTMLIGLIYYPIYYASLYFYPSQIVFDILYSLPFWLFIWIPLYSYSAQISSIYERATSLSNINLLIGIFRGLGGIFGGIVAYFLTMNEFFVISILLSLIIPIIYYIFS